MKESIDIQKDYDRRDTEEDILGLLKTEDTLNKILVDCKIRTPKLVESYQSILPIEPVPPIPLASWYEGANYSEFPTTEYKLPYSWQILDEPNKLHFSRLTELQRNLQNYLQGQSQATSPTYQIGMNVTSFLPGQVFLHGTNLADLGLLVGRESEKAENTFISTFEKEESEKVFKTLVAQLFNETALNSRMDKVVSNLNYLQIIGLGKSILFLLFLEFKRNPSYWMPAILAITRENIISEDEELKREEIIDRWMNWAKEKGYLING